jgi:hypothetical protein
MQPPKERILSSMIGNLRASPVPWLT